MPIPMDQNELQQMFERLGAKDPEMRPREGV